MTSATLATNYTHTIAKTYSYARSSQKLREIFGNLEGYTFWLVYLQSKSDFCCSSKSQQPIHPPIFSGSKINPRTKCHKRRGCLFAFISIDSFSHVHQSLHSVYQKSDNPDSTQNKMALSPPPIRSLIAKRRRLNGSSVSSQSNPTSRLLKAVYIPSLPPLMVHNFSLLPSAARVIEGLYSIDVCNFTVRISVFTDFPKENLF